MTIKNTNEVTQNNQLKKKVGQTGTGWAEK